MRRAPKKEQQATASANTIAVQQDWLDKDFVQSVAHGVAQLTTFLNDFGACTHALARAAIFLRLPLLLVPPLPSFPLC